MGYSKQETIKKQKRLVSKSQRNKRKVLVGFFKILLVALIAVVIAGAGAGFGMMKGILDHAPDINDIDIQPEGFRTVIYDANGNAEREVASYESNRVYVYYDEIPKDVINAFVAIEDERFWTHNGIDVKGIFRAFVKGAASGEFDEGASTLTQQLIKNSEFDVGMNERTFLDKLERKIQEQYLALELEKKYTKEQIVEYYLNIIYLGRGAHGIEAASEQYFGKEMSELSISEIAVIAGITQNPSKYDPVIFPENNRQRRQDVLDKMLEQEYITEAQYNMALADDVYSKIAKESEKRADEGSINTYYEDAIITRLASDFMELYDCTEGEALRRIYNGGYSVYSVQDMAIQNIVDNNFNNHVFDYIPNATVGLEYELTIIDKDGQTPHNYSKENLISYFKDLTGNDKFNNIFDNESEARQAANTFKEAMLDKTGGTFSAENFYVSPQPQFAFTIMDQKTGYVKAMFAGRGEKTANRVMNRATDAKRQPGSTFKILAAYLPLFDTDQGCLAYPFKDEPYRYANGGEVRNWYGGYRDYNTCRDGIRDSMNVLAVKAITKVTPEVAYDYLLKVGLTTIVDHRIDVNGDELSDINQSAALGGLTDGVTTFEMTAAYASIANGGVYTKPVLYSKVIDHDGNVVIDNTTPTTHVAMKATTAWQLITGMRDVVTGGTGTAARMTNVFSCGKTGTTSESYDLWFCGMSPYYTAAVWMGFDSNVSMDNMGISVVHEYLWRDAMDAIADMEGQSSEAGFEKPEGITSVSLCKLTGKYPGPGCPTVSDYCSVDFSAGGTCGGHQVLKFCKESKKIATDECPETVEFTVEIDESTGRRKLVSSAGSSEKVTDFEFTEEVCPLHGDKNKVTVTTSAGPGGTITPTAKVPKGTNYTVTITPNPGNKIKNVIVNGKSVGATSSYTFNNIQKDATVTATFEAGDGTELKPNNTTETPTTEAPTTEAPTTQAPTTEAPPTEAPTTEAPPTETPQEEQPPINVNQGIRTINSRLSLVLARLGFSK